MKIICVGWNYVAHANELGSKVPKEPVIFMKPDSALLRNNDPFYIPDWTNNVHYELELVVRINKLGKSIEPRFASRYYSDLGLGVDFTARDLQNELINQGHPWEKSKAFDQSAAISSEFVHVSSLPDLSSVKFELMKNGVSVQTGDSSLMIFSIDQLIAHISKYFTLKIGDFIYTGTPVGVGPVQIGDHLEGFLEGKKLLDFVVK